MSREHEYPFFTNRDCPYFPCHEGIEAEEFNCLFCYCPLYALGPRCGGSFRYTEQGYKDCTPCTMTHRGDAGTRLVRLHWPELAELARQGAGEKDPGRQGACENGRACEKGPGQGGAAGAAGKDDER
jgi:Zn-finger protein